MSSLSRDLIDAALAADLSKNEYKVFLALFRQTLCYGKASDPLTLKRLADLTGIRKDRLAQAVQGVITKGLFEATEHKIFDTLYVIGSSFLNETSVPFFAPHLPVNGMSLFLSNRNHFRKTGGFTRNSGIYIYTPYSINQHIINHYSPANSNRS